MMVTGADVADELPLAVSNIAVLEKVSPLKLPATFRTTVSKRTRIT